MTEMAELIDATEPVVLSEPEEGAETQPEAEATEPEEGEVVVTIEGEAPPQDDEETKAPEWVRLLRRENREAKKRIRELEAAQQVKAEPAPVDPGPKPTLQGCDYDEAKFEAAFVEWQDAKAKAEKAKADREAEQKAQQTAWQERVSAYQAKRDELRAPDFDDAEEAVKEALNVTQQGIIVQGATNPALVVYALGKRPDKAKELALIKDPVQFAFAVARLEGTLTVQTRKPAVQPEKVVTGAGRPAASVDTTLEKLREEAARTGNFDKVLAYKRNLAKKG